MGPGEPSWDCKVGVEGRQRGVVEGRHNGERGSLLQGPFKQRGHDPKNLALIKPCVSSFKVRYAGCLGTMKDYGHPRDRRMWSSGSDVD